MEEHPAEHGPCRCAARSQRQTYPTLAEATAETMKYLVPSAVLAIVAATCAYLLVDPGTRRASASFLICKPTEEIAAVASATDLAKLVESIDLPASLTAGARISARADRGSELATLTITPGPGTGAATPDAIAEAVVAAANRALEPDLQNASGGIQAMLAAYGRSIEDATALVGDSAKATIRSDEVSGILMSHFATLRDAQAVLIARQANFRGIRVLGAMRASSGSSSATPVVAAITAGIACLIGLPMTLRFAGQVAAARRAMRDTSAK
jgi:hypothetical protein